MTGNELELQDLERKLVFFKKSLEKATNPASITMLSEQVDYLEAEIEEARKAR